MAKCKANNKKGQPCGAHAITGSDYCWFHSPTVKDGRVNIDMSAAAVRSKEGSYSYQLLFGKRIGERPRIQRLMDLKKLYDDGGIITRAIDSYVAVATANGYQLIDTASGETESDNTDVIEQLDYRVDMNKSLMKTFRNTLNYGFTWGSIITEGNKITNLLYLPSHELELDREEDGTIVAMRQIREGKIVEEWKGEKLKDAFYITGVEETSEPYPIGFLERVYTDAKEWKELGEDLQAVTKFVSYPFRVVKVGSDVYPASEAAVTKVGDEVEKLKPGDWLATRHNLEFEFHAPEVPDALIENYKSQTREMIVALGVPSLYTALDDIDAQTLKEIRSLFNATVRSLQIIVGRQFEEQIIKRQFELRNELKLRKDKPPVVIAWNPLTVSVLSILEMTQLVEAGVIGISEARRILESMGYGLLRGDTFKKERKEMLQEEIRVEKAKSALKNPKQTHPSEDKPDAAPNKSTQPRKDGEPAKTKKPSDSPKIKRKQPNSPKLSYEQWLEGVKAMGEVDKFEAFDLLRRTLWEGFVEEDS
jgi:hypothetical protein